MIRESKKSISSTIYDISYYSDHSKGFKSMIDKISPYLKIEKKMNILDLGCGAGLLSIYMAKRGARVAGVDYSVDAIKTAEQNLSEESINIKNNVKFILMNAKDLRFKKSYFDTVVAIDVFEHVFPEELVRIIGKIKYVLKPDGVLFIHTEANKIYLNFIHRLYVYPMNLILIFLNKLLTKNDYPSLPKNPRSRLHKIQHVNEPTYFYLHNLFRKFGFIGKIVPLGLYKKHLSWKDVVYNIIVFLYPLSLYFPLSILFSYDYICVMKKKI